MARTGGDFEYIYLTTTGRRTGNPHTIEIWAAEHEGVLYLLAGGRERSDWVRNLRANPSVGVRIGERTAEERAMHARVVSDPAEDTVARRVVAEKYRPRLSDEDMTGWARTALPVAIERSSPPAPL